MKKYFLVVFLSLFVNFCYAEENKFNEYSAVENNNEEYDADIIYDPFEPVNRGVYSFNKTVDSYVIKPVAETYEENIPTPIQLGVKNIFNYIRGPIDIINFTLQGNKVRAGNAMGRLLVNTFGLAIFDIASQAEIPLEQTNFGETLGVWGIGEGPYVVLPILGGGTLRDKSAQLAVDIPISIETNLPINERNISLIIKTIDLRKDLLKMDKTIEEASLDEYSFVKRLIISNKRSTIKELQEKEE